MTARESIRGITFVTGWIVSGCKTKQNKNVFKTKSSVDYIKNNIFLTKLPRIRFPPDIGTLANG